MLFGSWLGRFDLVPWATAVLGSWLAWEWLPGTWYIVVGAVGGCLAAALLADPEKVNRSHPPEQEPSIARRRC
jgi:predicted branched-subunit amino acid permease